MLIKGTNVKNIMTEKRLRLTVDFKITAGEITREFVENYYRNSVNYQEVIDNTLTWELAARENRLLDALIRNDDALDMYLTYAILDEVDPGKGSLLRELLVVGREEEILEPVIRSLSKDDAEFFIRMIEEGRFQVNTELFTYRIAVEWLRAELTEIRVVAGADGGQEKSEIRVGE
jgi:hypothetical protein